MWTDSIPRIWNNPIIQRESIVRLRMFSSFLFLGGVLIAASIVMLMFLELIHTTNQYITYDQNLRNYFTYFNILLLCIISSVVPFVSASAINHEKERETWELLASTPLSYVSIYCGKFISSIGFIWLIFIAMVPLYGIFFLSGSVSYSEVIMVFLGLTEIALVLSAVGLFCSSLYKKTVHSVLAAFVISTLYLVVLPFLWLYIFERMSGLTLRYDMVVIFSPILHLYCYISGNFPPSYYTGDTLTYLHIVFTSLLLLGIFAFSIWMLDRQRTSQTRRFISDKLLNFNSTWITALMSKITPKADYPDGKNPVMIKDLRMMLLKRWSYIQFVLLFIAAFICSVNSGVPFLNRNAFNRFDNEVFWLIFMPLLVLPYASNAFRFEKDQNTFDLLLTTKLSARQIAMGKLWAGLKLFIYRYLVFWGVIFGFVLFFYSLSSINPLNYSGRANPYFVTPEYQDFMMEFIFIVSVYPIVCAAFLLIFGMYCSAVMKNTNTAYAVTFFSTFMMYFGVPLAAFMIRDIPWIPISRTSFNDTISLISPLWFMSCLADTGRMEFKTIPAINIFQIQTLVLFIISVFLYHHIEKSISQRND